LQTGLINTVAASPIAAIALQWHTQVEYILDLPIIYIYALLAIEEKAFNKISDEDQAIVDTVMREAFKKNGCPEPQRQSERLCSARKSGH
jgi:TRAP-type C4-dicarboxylate transport system substrate-binding protein